MKDCRKTIRTIFSGVLHIALYAVLFLLLAACALVCMEAIWRGSFSEAVMWASRSVKVALQCVQIIALLEALLYAVSGRLLLSVGAVNFLLMGIALIQHYKLKLRGEDFLFSDIMLMSEAAAVIEKFEVTVSWYVIAPCALLALLALCVWGMRLKGHVLKRLAAGGVCAVLLAGCGGDMLKREEWSTSTRDYYKLNGLIAGLAWSAPRELQAPQDYSRETIEKIVAQYTKPDTAPVLPDIFFIMSESLYDLDRLDELHFSEDMMPYFRSLQQSHWGGQLCVVPFGGGTVNTEYAMLTGYLPDTTMVAPYLNRGMIQEGMLCIPQMLRDYGYHTQAMHPNVGSMYNRINAYPNLGFEEIAFIDDMPPVDDTIGGFPSDAYLYDEIIRRYEGRPSDQPYFSFVVTYQNHGGYGYGYDAHGIRVTDAAGREIAEASTYANAVKTSDEELKELVAYFELQERPVILVLFGDHAPSLEAFGYQRSSALSAEYLTHTTPVLVYSNFGFEMQAEQGSTISIYRFGAMVMDALGLHADRYFSYLADNARENIYTLKDVVVDDDALIIDPARYEQAEHELALLNYDRIAGKQYSRKGGDVDE